MKKIKIYYLTIEDIIKNEEYIVSYISKERLDKAKKYIIHSDYLLSIGGSYLIYKYCGRKVIHLNKNGKPYMDNVSFSISHSKEMVAISVYSKPIGLDIEYIRPLLIDIKNTIATKEEQTSIHNNGDLFKLWCLKESLGKCIGIGLNLGIKYLSAKEGIYQFNGKTYVGKSITYNNYQIALTIKDDKDYQIELMHEEIVK